jgi:hypothetical protein
VDLPELERQEPLQGFRWLPISNVHLLAAAALESDGATGIPSIACWCARAGWSR